VLDDAREWLPRSGNVPEGCCCLTGSDRSPARGSLLSPLAGEVYETLGNVRAAREAYLITLELDPTDAKAQEGLARIAAP
jgi:hypothetical protein